ncbi:MAG TPA: peptidylprolyl isomerase [archaeon]|nr:peptidylprolyl isomerase [archaeon]
MAKRCANITVCILPLVLSLAGCENKPENPYLQIVQIEQLIVKPRPSAAKFEKTRQEAEKVLQKLSEGADFAETARIYSTHSSSSQGGELTLTQGWMDPAFDDAVFAMEDSSLSGVIQTPAAFYIVYRQYGEYLEVRTNHILIKPFKETQGESEEQTYENARRKALTIYKRIQQGESFYDLARQYSEDEGTAKNGGDVGWTKRHRLDPSYEAVAFAQVPGQISEPVKTRFGYHIIRTVKKKSLNLHVKMIEFKVPLADEDRLKARTALEEARKQALAGTSLKTLAESSAGDPAGEFIYNEPYEVRKSLLLPGLASQIEKMDEGDISGIIENELGYFFVRLIKKD